jgi:hypothetical protein
MRLRHVLWVIKDEGPVFSRSCYVRLFEVLSKMKPESVVMIYGTEDWRIPCLMSKLNLKKVMTFVYGDYFDGTVRRMLGGGAKFGNQGKVNIVLREQEPNFVKLWSFPIDTLIITSVGDAPPADMKKLVSSIKRGGTLVTNDFSLFKEQYGNLASLFSKFDVFESTVIGVRR